MVAMQPARTGQPLIGTQRVQQIVEARRQQAELQAQQEEAEVQRAQERLRRARAEADRLAQMPVSNYNFEKLLYLVNKSLTIADKHPLKVALKVGRRKFLKRMLEAPQDGPPLTPEDVHDIKYIVNYAFFEYAAKRDPATLADDPLFAEVVEMEMRTQVRMRDGSVSTLEDECIVSGMDLAGAMFRKKRIVALLAPPQSGKTLPSQVVFPRFAGLLGHPVVIIHSGNATSMEQAINEKLPNYLEFYDIEVVLWDDSFVEDVRKKPEVREKFLAAKVQICCLLSSGVC